MIGFKKTAMVALLAGLGFTGASQATLIARAGGMVYDDVNNITWAADANLFKTQAARNPNLVNDIIAGNGGVIHDTPNAFDTPALSGIHNLTSAWDFNTDTGGMTWWGAQAWANDLTLGGVKGWSLPGTPVEVSGYAVINSPMGDLFYKQLGVIAGANFATNHNANYNLFTNVQNFVYWSGSEYAYLPDDAWGLFTFDGQSYTTGKGYQFYALAVHPGDVSAVPEPAIVWLLGVGLSLLALNRRKNQNI